MAKVTLGEVAMEARETCKGDRSGFHTVGLEHITPGEIRLSEYDVGSDNTFTKRFHEGDILFGRRRAYLKKAAIAPFEGICSGDITVIRAIQDKMEPRLLPFVIQNDDFFDFAVGRSAGSLSPRVKWEHLKTYSFELPEMDKQRELADVLWAIEDTRAAYQELAAAMEELVKSRFVEMFGDPVTNPMGWEIKSLSDMGDYKNGMNFHKGENGVELHCLGVGDFQNLSIIDDTSTLPIISLNDKPSKEYLLQNDDIVFVRSNGNKNLVGRCLAVYPNEIPTVFSGFCIRFRLAAKEQLTIGYLLQVLKHESMRQRMTGRGANIQNLNQQILSRLDIPLPPLALQNEFAAFVEQVDKSKFDQLGRSSSCLMKTILRKK